MIRPEGLRGAAFGTAGDGDGRTDPDARSRLSEALGIPPAWATISQVHGSSVAVATGPGPLGPADAAITARPLLPVAVATADCVPIVVEGETTVTVVHAGWRGLAAGVISAALDAVVASGDVPRRAAIGPCIGPCCYEVGDEVAERFADDVATTTWGTTSVDLRRIAARGLGPSLETWTSDRCTMTDDDLHSHRRNGTRARQVTVAWLPAG